MTEPAPKEPSAEPPAGELSAVVGAAQSRSAAVHFNRAVDAWKAGSFQKAEVELNAALRLDPSHPKAHNNLGLLLMSRGDLAAAARHFKAAIRFWPEYSRSHNNLGVAYLRMGRVDWAAAQFKQALLADHLRQTPRRNLAALLRLKSFRMTGEELKLSHLAGSIPFGWQQQARKSWFKSLFRR